MIILHDISRYVLSSDPEMGSPRHLSTLDGANAVMVKRGLQLPTGLPEVDLEKSCTDNCRR